MKIKPKRFMFFLLKIHREVNEKSWINLKNRLSNDYWRDMEEFMNLANRLINLDML